ncbi:MAG: hypothetical protein ACR2RV_29125 [Verrucomicrobiales bacterium]
MLALLALVLVGGWLAIQLWLIPFASKFAEEELAKSGYHVTYQEPDLSLWSAKLKVKNLTLHRTSQKDEPIIFVSDLGVDIDLRSLVLQKKLSGRTTIRRGNVIVFGERRQPDFTKLAVDIEFDQDGAQIKQCTGESNLGYHLSLEGAVNWSSPVGQNEDRQDDPEETDPPDNAEESEVSYPDFPGDLSRLEKLADLFFCEPQGDDLVTLELDLNWDQTRALVKPSEGADTSDPAVTLDGRILGRDVLWKKFPLEQLEASFRLEDWEVSIPEMRLTALTGEAVASGHLNLESNRFLVDQVRSSVNPLGVISRIAPKLADPLERIRFDENPLINGENIIVDFRDRRASRVALDVEALQGIRVLESATGGATLEFDNLRGSLEYGKNGSEDLLFRGITGSVEDLEIRAEIAITNFLSPRPQPAVQKKGVQEVKAGVVQSAAGAGPSPKVKDLPLVGLLSSLMQIESGRKPHPQLELDIISDWSSTHPQRPAIELSGQFSGSSFSWHGREIESASVEFGLENRLLELTEIEVVGLGGELRAAASYGIDERVVSVPMLTSTADISHLRKKLGFALPGILDSISFQSPPQLTVDGFELHLGTPPTGKGQVEFIAERGFVLGGESDNLRVGRLDLAMSWDAPQLLTVTRASGSVEDLEFDVDGALRWHSEEAAPEVEGEEESGSEAGANPPGDQVPAAEKNGIRTPLLTALSRNLSLSPNADPVRLEGHFEWDQTRGDQTTEEDRNLPGWLRHLTLESTLSGKDFVWRGFSVETSASNLNIADGSLQFAPFKIDTSDGSLEAQGSFAIGERKLRVDQLRSTADPFVLLEKVGLPLGALDDSIDFLESPKIIGRDIQLELDRTDMISGTIEVDDEVGVALNLPGGRQLVLQDFRGPLSFSEGEFRCDEISANILGGQARAQFRISPFESVPSYTSNVRIDGVSLAAMSDWFDADSGFDEAGTFDFSFEGSGSGALESLTGIGRAAIGAEGGSANHFPVLSGLVGFIDSGFAKEWDFDLPFGVSDGKIVTTAGKLNGHSISVHLSGSVDWVNDHVDFVAGVNLNGLIGVVTKVATPMREDFVEIVGQGTLDNVEWGTKHQLEPGRPRHHPWKPHFRKIR